MFFDKSTLLLKDSALAAHQVYAILLNFVNAYMPWLVQGGHTLVVFLPVEFATEQQAGERKLAEVKKSMYENYFSGVG